jgi:large conductance mechanosensitive channel
MNSLTKEFLKFLKEYKVVSLAVAFIMGEATSGLVSSFVKDVFLPIVAPLISIESWKTATLSLGPITIAYGTFVADAVNFIILALLIFLIARKFLELEKQDEVKAEKK